MQESPRRMRGGLLTSQILGESRVWLRECLPDSKYRSVRAKCLPCHSKEQQRQQRTVETDRMAIVYAIFAAKSRVDSAGFRLTAFEQYENLALCRCAACSVVRSRVVVAHSPECHTRVALARIAVPQHSNPNLWSCICHDNCLTGDSAPISPVRCLDAQAWRSLQSSARFRSS